MGRYAITTPRDSPSSPRRDFGWPPFSVARLRRFVIAAVITTSIAVMMLAGLSGFDAPPPPAVNEASSVFFPAMLCVIAAIIFSVIPGAADRTRFSVLRVAAAVALAGGPLWLAWVLLRT